MSTRPKTNSIWKAQVVRIKDQQKYDAYSACLEAFDQEVQPLIGLGNAARKDCFVMQLIDSARRIEFLQSKAARATSPKLHQPYSGSFDPFGGAAVFDKAGNRDDAYWLVYLATFCGKHKDDGWSLTEDIYGRFGQGGVWDWTTVNADPRGFEDWLAESYPAVTSAGRSRRFGNHRKFETLKPGPKGMGNSVSTYLAWIGQYGSHEAMIANAQATVGQNPRSVFRFVYDELDQVARFARLGKFDLLCNWSNLLIAPIIPDKAYIKGSTGPIDGAKLLFGNLPVAELEEKSAALAHSLELSPQGVEDALCNWQKLPSKYRYFKG